MAGETPPGTDLGRVREQLQHFVVAHVGPGAKLVDVRPGGGHAGFTYLFDTSCDGRRASYYLRLPPPGVRWEGTADVLRQVTALRLLDGTSVPHLPVVWSGSDLRWFERPYFVVPAIEAVMLADPEAIGARDAADLRSMAREAMVALAAIHQVDTSAGAEYLGHFAGLEHEITRWDRFADRAADRDELLGLVPHVRSQLLAAMPATVHIGLYHGDYQFQNLLYDAHGQLQAVIDWELCGVGPTLNDLGWITAFHDVPAWGPVPRPSTEFVSAGELAQWYTEALGRRPLATEWFEALSLYKYAIITCFNLMLHRRGKRIDPTWEQRRIGAPHNLARAQELLAAYRKH
jgi:aminoglycoside phosphotransferase (APT) family kinase protein